MEKEKIWSVSEVNAAVREVLEGGFFPFWMEAEVGTLNIYRSGHAYLTLKDSNSQIKAVFFRGAEQVKNAGIEVGAKVEVFGKLSVYTVRGEYQFVISLIRPIGIGDLQRKFEELKNKLAAEGFFDETKKKPIPVLPRTIGIVTSPDGAAVRDILQIINRRFPNLHIMIYPSAVQGKGAEKQLASGIKFFNGKCRVDVIIITRGGGSMEDLWPFNEEILAREISRSEIPVISAVGHEIDFTICDFVADLRVPTPSAAAELVVGKQEEFNEFIADCRRRLKSCVEISFERLKRRFQSASQSYVFREPGRIVQDKLQMIDELGRRMESSMSASVQRSQLKFRELNGKLSALSPMAVLDRGYSILTDMETGKVVTESESSRDGVMLKAVLAKGTLDLRVVK